MSSTDPPRPAAAQPVLTRRRRVSRRGILAGTAAGVAGVGAGAVALRWPFSDAKAVPELTTWPASYDFTLDAAREQSFLAEGLLPGAGTVYEPMARQAMLDLYRLMQSNGSAEFPYTFIAGPDGAWRYSWPAMPHSLQSPSPAPVTTPRPSGFSAGYG